jgi:2-polyprenyl-3-methyl-5-hydroxy-6-metoxy-1,4-benzoquinol methylase
MGLLRQRLFERYDEHYARGNEIHGHVTRADFDRCIPDYEASFGDLIKSAPPGSSIADVGCGMGFLLHWLHETRPGRFQLSGVDLSAAQLKEARLHLHDSVRLVQSDARSFLEASVGSFQVVFCTDLLEHIADEDEMLDLVEHARSALLPGGYFVCRVPNMANLVSPQLRYVDLTHRRGFTAASLLQLLEAGGLSQCSILRPKPADTGQAVRMMLERSVHRFVYRLCGVATERHFSRMLLGIGRA